MPRERKSISKIRKSERKKAKKNKTSLKPTWRDVKMKKKRRLPRIQSHTLIWVQKNVQLQPTWKKSNTV